MSSISAAFQALAKFLEALTALAELAPHIMMWISNNKKEALNDEIHELESAGNPANRGKLGLLRVKARIAGEFHAALLARVAPLKSGDAAPDA